MKYARACLVQITNTLYKHVPDPDALNKVGALYSIFDTLQEHVQILKWASIQYRASPDTLGQRWAKIDDALWIILLNPKPYDALWIIYTLEHCLRPLGQRWAIIDDALWIIYTFRALSQTLGQGKFLWSNVRRCSKNHPYTIEDHLYWRSQL